MKRKATTTIIIQEPQKKKRKNEIIDLTPYWDYLPPEINHEILQKIVDYYKLFYISFFNPLIHTLKRVSKQFNNFFTLKLNTIKEAFLYHAIKRNRGVWIKYNGGTLPLSWRKIMPITFDWSNWGKNYNKARGMVTWSQHYFEKMNHNSRALTWKWAKVDALCCHDNRVKQFYVDKIVEFRVVEEDSALTQVFQNKVDFLKKKGYRSRTFKSDNKK